MKFIHLSDLHIGKQLHHYNLKEDQEHILGEVISYVEDLHPNAVVIAGDIYDKSVPSAEAVALFDDFLTHLSSIEPKVTVMIVAGNHDSAQRLDYASRILGANQIYIAGKVPEAEEEFLKKVVLTDEYGPVNFYLLPFVKPGYVRPFCEGQAAESYTDAVKCLLDREKIDESQRNVLVSHQFYTGNGESPETCDSEMINVGGIDNVDISVIRQFDYVALGHLHGAQKVGEERIRYCGTLLKYSVSESHQEKSLHLVELGEKAIVTKLPLHPLRDVRKVQGTLQELLDTADPKHREDYVSVTLTDEIDPYKPKEQLEKVYRNILEIRVDNSRTRQKLSFKDEEIRIEDPMVSFCDFYREMQGRELGQEEIKILEQIFDNVKGEEV